MLRYDSPVTTTDCIATSDGEIGGRPVRRGMWARAALVAAHQAPARLDLPLRPRLPPVLRRRLQALPRRGCDLVASPDYDQARRDRSPGLCRSRTKLVRFATRAPQMHEIEDPPTP
ncbi:hypothetical protein GCM10027199_80520 [Amycolatopsis magusensis]